MLYTNSDGGARGNPGAGAIAVILRNGEKIISTYSKFIGDKVTNNIAEYESLIKAMELGIKLSKEITCILDSELVVKQMNGEYKVKDKNLKILNEKANKMAEKFEKIHFRHVSRDNKFQQIADKLVNEEIDKKGF